jgi:hypothetical protein
MGLKERTLCEGLFRSFLPGLEDLNLGRYSFCPSERRLHEAVEQERHTCCPFLSNVVDKSQTVLLPVLPPVSGGRFGGSGFFLLKAAEAKEMANY